MVLIQKQELYLLTVLLPKLYILLRYIMQVILSIDVLEQVKHRPVSL